MYSTTNTSINFNTSKQFYNSKPRANSAIRRNHNTISSLSAHNNIGDSEINLPRVVGAYVEETSLVNNRAQSASSGMRRSIANIPQYSTMFQSTFMNGSTQGTAAAIPMDYDSFKAKMDKKNNFSNTSNNSNKLILIRPASSHGKFPDSNGNSSVLNQAPLLRSQQIILSNQILGITTSNNNSGINPTPVIIQSILKPSTATNINKSNVNSTKNSKKKICFANPLTTSQPLANPFEFSKKQQSQQPQLHTNINKAITIADKNELPVQVSSLIESFTISSSRDPSPLSVVISQDSQDPSPPPLILAHTNCNSPTLVTSNQGVKSGGGLFSTGSVGIGWGSFSDSNILTMHQNNNTTNNNASIATISPTPINNSYSSSTSTPPNTLHRKTINNDSQSNSPSPSGKPPLFTSLPITALLTAVGGVKEESSHLLRPAAILAKPSKDFETLLKSMQIEDDCTSVNSSSTTEIISSLEDGRETTSITTKSDGITVQINNNKNTKHAVISNAGIADDSSSSPFVPVKSTSLKPIPVITTSTNSTNSSSSSNTSSNKQVNLVSETVSNPSIESVVTTSKSEGMNHHSNNNSNKPQPIKKKFQRPSLTEQLAQISAKASAITVDIRTRSNSQDVDSSGSTASSLFQSNLNNAINIGRNSNGIYMNTVNQINNSNNNSNIGDNKNQVIIGGDGKLVFTMPSKSFSIGSLTCKYPSPVLFYTDRFEYLFNHPYESSAINMIVYYRDMQGVSIVGTKFRFKLSRKLALFLGDFDPQNPLHMIVLELSTSSSITAIREKVVPLIAQFK